MRAGAEVSTVVVWVRGCVGTRLRDGVPMSVKDHDGRSFGAKHF